MRGQVDGAQSIGHAPTRDHGACQIGRLLNVRGSPRSDVITEHVFCNAPAIAHRQAVEGLIAREVHAVLFREHHGHAQRHSARNDCDLVQWLGVLQQQVDQSVPSFVESRDALVFDFHDARLLGAAESHLVACFFQVFLAHVGVLFHSGDNRGLVHQGGEFSTREAWCAARNLGQDDFGGELHVPGVDPQDLFASGYIGKVNDDLAVEAAWAQERRVEHVGTVGRGDDDDVHVGAKAVHFDQDRVERLLTLVVSAAHSRATLAADSIDFIEEDDAGGRFARLFKQVAHAAGADANEHFNKVRAAN